MSFLRNIRSTFRRSRPAEMPCRDIVEVVTSYLEGDLDPELRARFEAHLAGCPDCVLYVEQMRQTIELTSAAGEPVELSPQLRAGLRRAFEGWAGTSSGR